MQTICISLQTDNHTNTPSLEFNHTNTPSLEFYRLYALRDTQAVKAQTSITNISQKGGTDYNDTPFNGLFSETT